MATISKTKKIELLAKLIQKNPKDLPNFPEREILGHLIYAALLENASYEQADAAFAVLENYFIDWNEIRVSTASELADTFPMLPEPIAAGERIRNTLQGVFEKTYMFDIEELKKKNLGQAAEFLHSIPGSTHFMADFTFQVAFNGHVIPLDEASRRIFRLLHLTLVNKECTREDVPGLERAIVKKNGLEFATRLHFFAAGYYNDPESTELRTILQAIDPEVFNRSWVPPVLTIVKHAVKTPPKPIISLPAVIPFAGTDDDEFEDDHGMEAEFLPDTPRYSIGQSAPKSNSSKASQKSKKSAKPAAKKEPPAKKTKGIEKTEATSQPLPPTPPIPIPNFQTPDSSEAKEPQPPKNPNPEPKSPTKQLAKTKPK
jgi:endonuclease-3